MLNRRYLRIKVLQALYAWFQSGADDVVLAEKEMFKSINRVYDLYLYMLLLIVELHESARELQETKKGKNFATPDDLNPNTHFTNNKAVVKLEENESFKKKIALKKLSWKLQSDNIRKLFRKIEEGSEYGKYMLKEEASFKEDKNFIATIYERYIGEYEIFEHLIEEADMYWAIDLELVNLNVVKTFHKMKEHYTPTSQILLELYRDKEDDEKFVKELFRKTLLNNDTYGELIALYTQNWEVDRLAKIDILLLKMGCCELEYCSNIPIKVSLNEYIDLSKFFSTPKSKGFINGVLDKVVAQWNKEGKIKKSGRGLME